MSLLAGAMSRRECMRPEEAGDLLHEQVGCANDVEGGRAFRDSCHET